MARKENIKQTTEEKYTIKNTYDSNGEEFEDIIKKTLKQVISSSYSCKTSKKDIKYF